MKVKAIDLTRAYWTLYAETAKHLYLTISIVVIIKGQKYGTYLY